MTAVWDGDTGTLTFTAQKKNATTGVMELVNLTGATLTVITRNRDTAAVVLLTVDETASDRPNGKVIASAEPLVVGNYLGTMRAEAGVIKTTYPSASEGPVVFSVLADLDAV